MTLAEHFANMWWAYVVIFVMITFCEYVVGICGHFCNDLLVRVFFGF